MGLIEKLFGKNKGQIDVWDSSLEEIPYQEAIRYKIYERLGKVKPGDSLTEEDIFGKGCVTPYDHYEFIGAILKLRNPIPVYETLEDVKDAEKSEGDDTEVMCKIANTYLGLSRYSEAHQWYNKAANLGNSNAMECLGGMYQCGIGVEPNINKAIHFFKRAIVVDGNRDALFDLGACYLNGDGVPENLERAFFLMERSAKQGNMVAQYNMGFMYCTGKGVDVDLKKSLHWFHLSAAQGEEQAIAFLEQNEEKIMSMISRHNDEQP